MKTLKLFLIAALVAVGLATASCKKDAQDNTEEQTEELVEQSTDTADGDTVITETDSITQTNRDDKSVGVGEQTP